MFAKKAFAAGDDEGYYHAITALEFRNPRTDIFDDAHKFMAEDILIAGLGDLSVVQMGVRPADRGRRDAENEIVDVGEYRVGYRFDTHVFGAMVGQCLHGALSSGKHERFTGTLYER